MVKKICRLCFKNATKPIGIFSAKGINHNIAEILRIHFPDEVNANFATESSAYIIFPVHTIPGQRKRRRPTEIRMRRLLDQIETFS